MEDLIAAATDFITAHGAWAGPIVGLMAFGESLAVVGLFIPSTAFLVAVGGLIGSGVVEPVPVFLWAVCGAVLGDWISYGIGRAIGPSVYRRWPLNRHRSMVARARLFFRRYGFISIFMGRFLGPIRSTIPLVAGVMDMRQRSFQIANVLSAVLWVPAMFAPGYMAVKGLGSINEITGTHLWGIVAVVVVLSVAATILGVRVLGRIKQRSKPGTRRLRESRL